MGIFTTRARRIKARFRKRFFKKSGGKKYGHVDAIFIAKNGKCVFEKKYSQNYREISQGKSGVLGCGWKTCKDSSELHDFNYLHPNFHPYYQGRQVHSLQSATKSIAATLIAIAILRGEIEILDTPLLSYFKNYNLSKINPNLKNATLRHLLTMKTGIEWHEINRPLDETNTTILLESSADWIQFTLDQPMDAQPGEKWAYNSGGSHLISGVIKKATGKYADEYAQKYLFKPLGINDFHWKKTPKGFPDTEGGLYLAAKDLAKIGQLYLQNGIWNGQRILPEGWVKEATSIYADNLLGIGWSYGYQWWRVDRKEEEIWAGLGFGDQYLLVFPNLKVVAVLNCWNVFGAKRQPALNDLIDAIIAGHK